MTKFTKNEINFINEITLDQCHIPTFLLKNYTELGLNDKDCLRLIAVINAMPKGRGDLSADDLQDFLGCSAEEAEAIVAGFVKRGILTRSGSAKQVESRYSLKNFYEEMYEMWYFLHACPRKSPANDQPKQNSVNKNLTPEDIKKIYKLFESEKGQPLSPTEIEKLNHWIIEDNWSAAMMKEALQRAVLHGTCNFAYIDKILLRWQKAGITQISQLDDEKDNPPSKKKEKATKSGSKEKIMTNETNYNDVYKI